MAGSIIGGVKFPKIYAFTFDPFDNQEWNGSRAGRGLLKVGYTEGSVPKRVKEGAGINLPTPADVKIVLTESALTDSGDSFKDHLVHKELVKAGVHRIPNTEWFECTLEELKSVLLHIKTSENSLKSNLRKRLDFEMRPEQKDAVDVTAKYFLQNANSTVQPHYLWNAKMRFGKTFATYQLAKKLEWKRILVLTYKPAVQDAWEVDLKTHKDFERWIFKGKNDPAPEFDTKDPIVWFASFQDVLGTAPNGEPKAKNLNIHNVLWDAVVIDEYHFGAWRDAARSLYLTEKESESIGDPSEKSELDTPDLDEGFTENLEVRVKAELKVRNYLYLSGTPFRALTQGEFLENQVFNWTYSDEQKAKESWSSDKPNPYTALPKMHLLAYEMPEKLREVALNNQSEFSLTEFFRAKKVDGKAIFEHEREVQKWLDVLRGQDITGLWANVANNLRPPLPFEDTNLLKALQHTIWYLPGVDACYAMANLLNESHNTFYKDYEIVIAAGTSAGVGIRALPPVQIAIGRVPQDRKTITLTTGKLLTGVTVPAWTGIFMLRELKSPEAYFQAAFRVQSPWTSNLIDTDLGGEINFVHKEHCYVIDFAPNRALKQIVDYATRLKTELASEKDDEKAIKEFMEFLPVLSFDGYAMNHLNASDVIDFLTKGVSSSMLARRWNSPELINLDLNAMQNLLADEELIASLEKIDVFRNISNELSAMISSTTELGKKKVAKEKPTEEENKRKDEAAKKREDLKQKLRRFLTRIPVFMYLTDNREKNIPDIILQDEPELFQEVTSLSVDDFKRLVNAKVFNESKMNDAVWKFRNFEEPSLSYSDTRNQETLGGWTLRKSERFAALVDSGILSSGDLLAGTVEETTYSAVVTDDYGLSVFGIRCEDPDVAAVTATGIQDLDGWNFWKYVGKENGSNLISLEDLL